MIHVVTWLIENAIAIVLSSNNEVIDLTTCVPTWRSLCSLTYSWAADLFISIPSSWMMIPPRHWIVYPPGINRGVEHCSNNPKRRTSPMPWQWYLGRSHPRSGAVFFSRPLHENMKMMGTKNYSWNILPHNTIWMCDISIHMIICIYPYSYT